MGDWCYNSAGTHCSGKAQPGTRALRDTMDTLLPWLGDYGIYNCRPTRTGHSLSLHGEGRAWDCAISVADQAKGDIVAQFYVDAAKDLGIQRVIWGFGFGKAPKEWDSREGQRYWSAYSGPAHDDHIHVELCWDAALRLTAQQVRDAFDKYWPGDGEEDFLAKLTEEEQQELLTKVRAIWKDHGDEKDGVYNGVLESVNEPLGVILARIEARLLAVEEALAGS